MENVSSKSLNSWLLLLPSSLCLSLSTLLPPLLLSLYNPFDLHHVDPHPAVNLAEDLTSPPGSALSLLLQVFTWLEQMHYYALCVFKCEALFLISEAKEESLSDTADNEHTDAAERLCLNF